MAWNKAHPERFRMNQRRSTLKRRYGITSEEFDALLAAQGGGCAVCLAQNGSWHVDHDHEDGHMRGILCARCNRSIGAFEDDESLLRQAAEYLATH